MTTMKKPGLKFLRMLTRMIVRREMLSAKKQLKKVAKLMLGSLPQECLIGFWPATPSEKKVFEESSIA